MKEFRLARIWGIDVDYGVGHFVDFACKYDETTFGVCFDIYWKSSESLIAIMTPLVLVEWVAWNR